jgi:hypothetical protein
MINASANVIHDSSAEAYGRVMNEIKLRLAAINKLSKILQTQNAGNLEVIFTWEQIALHLRKCLEHIVFSSMIANQDAYRIVYPDLADHWKINKILKKLDEINPDFFPVAIKISTIDTAKHHAGEREGPKLTLDDLIWLYDKCAELIHAFQPFKHGLVAQVDMRHTPDEWTRLIWNLLEEHYIVLYGGEQAFLVQMAGSPDGLVKVMQAVAVHS